LPEKHKGWAPRIELHPASHEADEPANNNKQQQVSPIKRKSIWAAGFAAVEVDFHSGRSQEVAETRDCVPLGVSLLHSAFCLGKFARTFSMHFLHFLQFWFKLSNLGASFLLDFLLGLDSRVTLAGPQFFHSLSGLLLANFNSPETHFRVTLENEREAPRLVLIASIASSDLRAIGQNERQHLESVFGSSSSCYLGPKSVRIDRVELANDRSFGPFEMEVENINFELASCSASIVCGSPSNWRPKRAEFVAGKLVECCVFRLRVETGPETVWRLLAFLLLAIEEAGSSLAALGCSSGGLGCMPS